MPRVLLLAAILVACTGGLAETAAAEPDWEAVVAEARGQTVYFNAWGGDPAINRYLDWAAERLRVEYGIRLEHVRLADIAEAVSRIRAERTAGKDRNGSVDLLWINGENFAALKRADLLYGPWAMQLPNAGLIDWQGNATTRQDGGLATEGFELPWGTASLTFFFDAERVSLERLTPDTLLDELRRQPGRFSYPQPPSFLGTAFLKQLLLALGTDRAVLAAPPGDRFDAVTRPLWAWLDAAEPQLWRGGRLYPGSGPAQRDLLAVGELDWMLSYNPAEAGRAIRQGELHDSIRGLHFESGALANSHFLAIPYNTGTSAAARVTANFLVSPEAQARKADVRHWGDPTVLDLERLDREARAEFNALDRSAAAPPPARHYLPEPHSAWTTRLEQAWLERYTRRGL